MTVVNNIKKEFVVELENAVSLVALLIPYLYTAHLLAHNNISQVMCRHVDGLTSC
jgi:hypothetical protein